MSLYKKYSTANDLVDYTDKPKLLLKVYEAILDKIDIVMSTIDKGNFEKKYIELSKVTNVLEILDASLDMSMGEISKNLSGIYRYLIKRLNEVHRNCDTKILEECKQLIGVIYDGFLKAYDKESENARASTQTSGSSFQSSGKLNITT